MSYVVNIDAMNDIEVVVRGASYRVADSTSELVQKAIDAWRVGWRTRKANTGLSAGIDMVRTLLPALPHSVAKSLTSIEVAAIYNGIAAARSKAMQSITEAENCGTIKVDLSNLGDAPVTVRIAGRDYEAFIPTLDALNKMGRLEKALSNCHINDRRQKRNDLIRHMVPSLTDSEIEGLPDETTILIQAGITAAMRKQIDGWLAKNGLSPAAEPIGMLSGEASPFSAASTDGLLSMLRAASQSMQ